VLQPQVAQEINDILSDPVARAPLGENDLVYFPGYDVAVKTGTTNNYRDAWTIGYTPNLVVGVWAGNNDNTAMTHTVSGFIVGPMWHEFMAEALPTRPVQAFSRTVLDESTLKPILRGDWQVAGQDGALHEILYWLDKDDPNGPIPGPTSQDPQFIAWDTAVHLWANTNGYGPGSPLLQPAPAYIPPSQGTSTIQTTQQQMIPIGPGQ